MAKKPTRNKKTTVTFEEGDREPGEELPPVDDSHLLGAMGDNDDPSDDDLDASHDEDTDLDDNNDDEDLVTVYMNGVPVQLTQESAEAYQEELRSRFDNTPPANVPVKDNQNKSVLTADDFQERFFTNPQEVLNELTNEITEQVTSQLTTAYDQDKALQAFWTQFYNEHTDLRSEDQFVKMVMQANFDKLQDLKGPNARKILADMVRAEMLRISGKNKNKNSNSEHKRRHVADLEGNTGRSPSPRPINDDIDRAVNVPKSLGEAIKHRRKMRTQKRA